MFLWNDIQKYLQELKNLVEDRCELRRDKKNGGKTNRDKERRGGGQKR